MYDIHTQICVNLNVLPQQITIHQNKNEWLISEFQIFKQKVRYVIFFPFQTEQIVNEYKIRALACHPDKHQDNPRAGRYVDHYLKGIFQCYE